MQYGQPATIYFQMFDETGAAMNSSIFETVFQWKISKDGGTFANTTNHPVYVGNLVYKLDLTAAEMTCDTFALSTGFQGEPPIIGETTRSSDISALAADLAAIKGLAGNFSVASDVLTAYNADGTTNAVYDLTRDQSGNITAIEPRSAQQ